MNPKIDLEEIYQPAEDTFLLLKAALKEARPEDVAVEIGCGRSLISREIALRVKSILSTDINPHAVGLAKEFGLEAVRADLFRGIAAEFDLVIFNPPYLPTIRKDIIDEEIVDGYTVNEKSIEKGIIEEESIEEKMARGWLNVALNGGATGMDVINKFLEDLKGHLSPKGRALLLISSITGLDEVMEKAKLEGFEAAVIASDKCFFERLYVIRLRVAHEFELEIS